MNAIPLAASRPLLDLLGARWQVSQPVTAVAWDRSGGCAGFGLADGSIAMPQAAWDGAPSVRRRDGGGAELVPASAPPPPVARVAVHDGACRSIAADPDGGFFSGGDDGRVSRIRTGGAAEEVAHFGGGTAWVAAGVGGWRACASGDVVRRIGHAAASVTVAGPVTSLALDPAGARLAIGHVGGVTLWAGGDAPRVLAAPGAQDNVAWTGDSRWLASATAEGALHVWRMPGGAPSRRAAGSRVGALVTLTTRPAIAAGAGGRVLCWNVADATIGEPMVCGVASQTEVTRIASHPRRLLIAAGYRNGAAVLCQPGSTTLLFLRGAGEGAVSALAFSPEGNRVAIGTDGGELGVLSLPDLLFRESADAP